jgi:hypothetical protein
VDKLKADLDKLIDELKNSEEFREQLDNLISVYPFNEYEYIISTLLGFGILTIDDYYELRDEYISRNLYLYIFEISAPRGFGEKWAQGHLKSLVPALRKPSKKLDPEYSGQYDFILDTNGQKIRIEVKASRAVDFDSDEPLYVKALSSDSGKRFDMNFQQVKPRYCDVFVWVAVWRDLIRYWVLASKEVENNRYYSVGQHRGNVGEGQLHVTQDNIAEFKDYEAPSDKLYDAILRAYERQLTDS